jgi:proteasome lid subunit RPN8/RPN11
MRSLERSLRRPGRDAGRKRQIPSIIPDVKEAPMIQTLPPAILAAFQAQAAQEAPREACGLVVQLPDGAMVFRPSHNLAESPLDGFEVDCLDWDHAEDEGPVVAVLHSHPDAPAKASPVDRFGCAESLIPWFILGQGDELVRVDPSDISDLEMAAYTATFPKRKSVMEAIQ